MNNPVQIGVQIQPQHSSYDQMRKIVQKVEDLGVDIIFNWDHFFPLYGDLMGKHFEAMSTMAAWAEQTTYSQIGNLVLCNSYRNPNLVADMVRTIDHISEGRFILGIGAGWNERDYREYHYPFGTAGDRLTDLAQSLSIISTRLSQLNPPPIRKIPILIGGGGEKKTLPLVAKYADIWHWYVEPAEYADTSRLREIYQHKAKLLAEYAPQYARDPSEIIHSTSVDGGDNEQMITAQEAVNMAQERYEWGIRIFTYGISGPHYDLRSVEALLSWRDSLSS